MGKLTSTIGIPIKLLNEAQVRVPALAMRSSAVVWTGGQDRDPAVSLTLDRATSSR